jgi:transposase-like protein
MNKKVSSESVVKDIRRRTRKKYSSEEKIRIVLAYNCNRGCRMVWRSETLHLLFLRECV